MSSSTLACNPLLSELAGELDRQIAELTPRDDPERRERVGDAIERLVGLVGQD